MHRLTVTTTSRDETRRLGEALGRSAQGGDILLLDGPFGAGKTVLVQGIAAGLGIDGSVSSPSFIMINEHHGRLRLVHVDLYRIEGGLDAETLDALEEYLDGDAVCAVEWPDLLPSSLRAGATEIGFTPLDESTRQIDVASPSLHVARAVEEATGDSRQAPGEP